jgi:hypothetical protein
MRNWYALFGRDKVQYFSQIQRQVCSHLVKLIHHKYILQGELQTMSEKIVQLNEGAIKNELKELVRTSVEETLNGLLDQEAEQLGRQDTNGRSSGRRTGAAHTGETWQPQAGT